MEAYMSMITPYGCNFVILNWGQCAGGLLSINQFQALFSLLGTNFGGDGRTTFGLPELRGRSAANHGYGPGLNPVTIGQRGGVQSHTLSQVEMPAHDHSVSLSAAVAADDANLIVSTDAGTSADPDGNYLGQGGGPVKPYATTLSTPAGTQSDVVDVPARSADFNGNTFNTGGSQPFYTQSPYQGVNYQICMAGIFPSRN